MNAKAALETIQNIENNIICLRETTMVAIKESLKQLRALERQLKTNVVDDIIVIKSDSDTDITSDNLDGDTDDNNNDHFSYSYPETEEGNQSDAEPMDDLDEEMSEDFGPAIKRKLEDPRTSFSVKRRAINVAYRVSNNKRRCHFENNDYPKRAMLSHDRFIETPPKKRNIRDVHDQTSVYLRSKYDGRAKRPKRSVPWSFHRLIPAHNELFHFFCLVH